MIRRTLLALLALVFVAGASACGGDDGGDDDAGSASDAGGEEAGGEEDGTEGGTADAASPDDMSTQLGGDPEFTGEGSEPFCTEVAALQESEANDPAAVDDATFSAEMEAIEPPGEIADEWTTLYTVQQQGAAMDEMSQEDAEEWSRSGAMVAAYLTDVCGLDDSTG